MRSAGINNEPRLAAVRDLFLRVPDWAILLFFFALILLQAVPSLRQESLTFDELLRQLPGYLHLTKGEFRIHTEHPPFIKMLTALPLLLLDAKVPPPPEAWTESSRWQNAYDFLYIANDADRLTLLGRLAVLPLTLLLGFFVFRWSKRLFGRGAAIFALFLYSFEPNILAHGRLMNTDLGVACFLFLTMYFFSRMIQEVTLARSLLAGLSLGMALATKYSALWAPPILIALGFGLLPRPMTFRFRGRPPAVVKRRVHKVLLISSALVVIGFTALVVIWGLHGFRYEAGTTAGYAYARPWMEVLPERPLARAAILWAQDAKVLPEAYLHGLSVALLKVKRSAFLMGEISADGWTHYFLVTFLLKTPLPFLLLLVLATVTVRATWRKREVEAVFLLVPVILHFAVASGSRLNIGHRHLLPIYPFLFVLASALIPWLRQKKLAVKAVLATLAAWYFAASISISPHYLAYFNELVGGPGHGYRYLVDSNLDWGQDLKGLKRYMEEHRIERVWLSYFGTASPTYHGITYNYLPSYVVVPNREMVPTPFVAISATNLQGVYFEDPDLFKKFRTREPVAKIGYSIFIYRLY